MSQVVIDEAVGYALKRAASALRAAMDVELRRHELSVPQYACLELLAQRPGLSNAQLARGAFVTRQAMHQLLGGLRAAGLVSGEGRGRNERLAITPTGRRRLAGASEAVAAIQEQMLASFAPSQRTRLHADLSQCADALAAGRRSPTGQQPAT